MNLYKKRIAYLLLFTCCNHIHATQYEAKSLEEEQETKSHAAEIMPSRVYKLVLPNGESIDFDKELLQQSTLLAGHIGFLAKSERGQVTELPITQYITKLNSDDPDELTLVQLHAILSALAAQPHNVPAALAPLIGQQPSFNRFKNLVQVALYFGIEPLLVALAPTFAEHYADPSYKAIVAELPDSMQKKMTVFTAARNSLLQNFISTHQQPIRTLEDPLGCTSAQLGYTIAWSPDGTQLASQAGESIQIWDVRTNTVIRTLKGHTASIYSIAWSNNGKYIASASLDGTVKIWNPDNGTMFRNFTIDDYIPIAVAWSPDNERVAIRLTHGFSVWNTITNTLIYSTQQGNTPVARFLNQPIQEIYSIAWLHSNPQLLVVYMNNNHRVIIIICDILTGRMVQTIATRNNPVSHAFAWSPDDKHFASSPGFSMQITNIATNSVQQFVAPPHYNYINFSENLAYSPDGTQIAATSRMNRSKAYISVWDVTTGTLLRALQNDLGLDFESIAWSPDGTQLAAQMCDSSNTGHGFIKIWDMSLSPFELTIAQIQLLEKIITAKKVRFSYAEEPIYQSLPQVWKDMFYQAGYGIPIMVGQQSSSWISKAYHYLTGKK